VRSAGQGRKTGENSHFKNALQPRWTPGFNSTSNPVLGKFAGIHGRPFEDLALDWLVKRRPKPWRVLSDGGAKGRPGTGWRANMAIRLDQLFGITAKSELSPQSNAADAESCGGKSRLSTALLEDSPHHLALERRERIFLGKSPRNQIVRLSDQVRR